MLGVADDIQGLPGQVVTRHDLNWSSSTYS